MNLPPQRLFWFRWLVVVTAGVLVFGLILVVAPGVTRQVFGLLIFSSTESITGFGAQAVPYIDLLHGVLGAVLFGWGMALMLVLLGPFWRGSREGWLLLVVSLLAWFIPDTALSLWSGFWQNAVLNLVFAVLFAIPLAATYTAFHKTRPSTSG